MGVLSGIRVIDLSAVISGPLATAILADQGAEVIKVEPLGGESLRHMSRSKKPVPPTFFSCNRGKKSLPLDLKSAAGRAVLDRLIASADVLVQNFRPGAMARMGFDEARLRSLNPGLIYVSISGFGEDGPYAGKRVYDPVIQALSAATDIQADRASGYPQMFRLVVADKVTSLTAAQAVTAALFARTRTGEGQHIRISMLDAMVSFLWPSGMAGLTFAEEENVKQVLGTRDLVFETVDGFITAGAVSDSEWRGLCRALAREDLLEDPRFNTTAARAVNADERRDVMAAALKTWPSAEILERLDANDVPCAPILDRAGLMQHEQLVESGTIERRHYAGYGEVRQPRPPARFDRLPSAVAAPAPQLGEHAETVLRDLGYAPAEIAQLLEQGVTHQTDGAGTPGKKENAA